MAQLTFDGRPVSSNDYKRLWTERLRTDPEMQRIFADITSPDYVARSGQARQAALAEVQRRRAAGEPVDAALSYAAYGGGDFSGEQHREIAARERASQLGFQPQDDWTLDFDQGGFRVERENFVNRNKEWLIPAAVGGVGVAGGLGAFGGAAGAASGGTAASSAVPAAGTSLGPGVGFGAGGVPVASTLGGSTIAGAAGPVAAGAATAAGSSVPFWLKAAAGFAGDAAKSYFSNRTAGKVNDELQRGGQQALDTYKDAFAPYMQLGSQAAGNLNYLMGGQPMAAPAPAGGGPLRSINPATGLPSTGRIDPAQGAGPDLGTAMPRPTTGRTAMVDPQGMGGNLGSLIGRTQAQQQTASSFVRMIGPDGTEDDVHPSQVQNAIRIGARPVQAGAR